MMRKTNEGRSPAGTLLPSCGGRSGWSHSCLCWPARVLLHRGILPEYAVAPSALAFLAAGGLMGGFAAAKRAAGRRLIWAMGAGAAVFLILLVVGSAAAIPAGEHCPHSGQPAVRDSGFGARRSRRRQHTPQETTQSHKKVGGNYYEARIDSDLCNPEADRCPRWLRRVPDFLPVCLQDFLHGCEPEV